MAEFDRRDRTIQRKIYIMASTVKEHEEKSKPSAKYDEYLSGDENDSLLIIEPTEHLQC